MNYYAATGHVAKINAKTLGSGQVVTNITLAVRESYRKDDKWEEKTHFFNVTLWKESRLKVGDLIALQAKLQNRSYEKDGQKVYVTDIVAHSVELLHRKKSDDLEPKSDDLPFK